MHMMVAGKKGVKPAKTNTDDKKQKKLTQSKTSQKKNWTSIQEPEEQRYRVQNQKYHRPEKQTKPGKETIVDTVPSAEQ